MSDLTPGAALAWQIAQLEADGAGHEHVERAHVLIGVFSLEKFRDATGDDLSLPPERLAHFRQEIARVDDVLLQVQAKAEELRRSLRDELGLGRAAPGTGSAGRSAPCKRAFQQAAQMAKGVSPSALHLLAAIAGDPDGPTDLALRRCGVDGERLAIAALGTPGDAPAAAREEVLRVLRPILDALAAAVRRQHGVELRFAPEAEAFLAEEGLRLARSAQELAPAVERLVGVPLGELVSSGKLTRHAAWRLEYDEGGVYLLPA